MNDNQQMTYPSLLLNQSQNFVLCVVQARQSGRLVYYLASAERVTLLFVR